MLIGWAFADSVLHRLAPLWVGARGLEFTWEYILQGLEANANLVCSFLNDWNVYFPIALFHILDSVSVVYCKLRRCSEIRIMIM